MSAELHRLWSTRTRGQRALIMVLLLLLASALYAAFVYSAHQAREQLQTRISVLQRLAAQVDQQAQEFEQLRALPVAALPTGDLYAYVQARLADGSGLIATDVRVESMGANRVRMALRPISFAQWLDWLDVLAAQRIQMENCQIEALDTPGSVSVTADLVRIPSP